MRTTIDKAGRLVLPKVLREQVGLRAGVVDVSIDGAGIRIEPVSAEDLVEEDGRWVIPSAGQRLDDEVVRAVIDAGRR
ncbi:MAG: AbrB/MazE/SpoVT family DNA-binding domain-containing protein [Acidimicrobiales bacterium]